MKRITVASILALVVLLLIVGVAYAITNGEPDGGRHPYVGLLIFDVDIDPDPDTVVPSPAWRCSGALIAPDVVLTAGHCTDGAVGARIWMEEGPVDWGTWDPDTSPICGIETGYPCIGDAEGTPYTNPDYDSDENPYGGGNGLPAFSYRDVGIVVLDEPIMSVTEFAELPDAGLVDTLKNKSDVDLVGYGVQYQAQIPGAYLPQPPPYYRWAGERVRLYAPSEMVSGKFVFSPEYMRLSMNPGGGTGGTNIVLSVNSFVTNVNCKGVGYSSRVDIPEVLEWIGDFMP